jgi:hypothetical protein
MCLNHHLSQEVLRHIGYFAGQANALKTMAYNKRNCYDLAVMLLAAIGAGHKLFPLFYYDLYDQLIDLTNTLLEHPGLDEASREKVSSIRLSANDMELMRLVQSLEVLQGIQKLLA